MMWVALLLLATLQQLAGAVPLENARVHVTDLEVVNLGEEIYRNDENKAIAGQDFRIDVTGRESFVSLLGMYTAEIGVADDCDDACRGAQNAFLDAALQTNVMKTTWRFLSARGYASGSIKGFKRELKNLWFRQYSRSRGRALDSSGFEHVFCGEIRGSSVTGFHSWIQYYLEESDDRMSHSQIRKQCQPNQLSFPFMWKRARKTFSSLAFGMSPEAELATYTMCSLLRPGGTCTVQWGGNDVNIVTYTVDRIYPPTIATAYPRC